MKLPGSSFVQTLLRALLVLSEVSATPASAQTAQKAIVLGWDGAVPAFVGEMLRQGKLPHLAQLIEGGAFANDVIPGYPSKTAPGFASLMTGAPARITGISGNRVPRAPQEQFTILESSAGFAEAPLRAEPIWAAAQRAGKKTVVAHIPSFADERAERTVRLAGYDLITGRDGIVTKRAIQTDPPTEWLHPPASNAPLSP